MRLKEKTYNNLIVKLKRIKIMKWLLDLEENEENFTEQYLYSKLNEITSEKFSYLVMFHYYILKMPKSVNDSIKIITKYKNNLYKYKKYYKLYLKNYRDNTEFIEYNYLINLNIFEEILKNIRENETTNVDLICKLFLNSKRIQ